MPDRVFFALTCNWWVASPSTLCKYLQQACIPFFREAPWDPSPNHNRRTAQLDVEGRLADMAEKKARLLRSHQSAIDARPRWNSVTQFPPGSLKQELPGWDYKPHHGRDEILRVESLHNGPISLGTQPPRMRSLGNKDGSKRSTKFLQISNRLPQNYQRLVDSEIAFAEEMRQKKQIMRAERELREQGAGVAEMMAKNGNSNNFQEDPVPRIHGTLLQVCNAHCGMHI